MNSVNKKRATKGVTWSAVERFSTQGVQFVISVILARLLLPEDFGLIALVLVVINILQAINEEGFNIALMQKLDRDDLDFSTVFVMNMFLGIMLYGVLYAVAPLIALLFEQPNLTSLTRIVGLNLIITSFVVVQRTKLFILVDFKTQSKASLVAAIVSGFVGIYCAYHGYGVMALIYQSLLNNGINTLLIWLLVGWRPQLKFSFQRFVNLFSFAYKLILVRMINVTFNQLYSAAIGKFYSFSQLGFFNRANSFVALSSNNITGVVQRVSTPMLCEAQNDHKQMARTMLKFMSSTALIVYPLLFGLFVLSDSLIVVLLTDKWMPAAWMLRVLCPVGLMHVVSTFNRNVFNATGRTDLALKTEITKKIIFVVVIAVSISLGFVALILSQVVIALINLIIDTYYTKMQIGIRIHQQLRSLSGVFMASSVMALLVWLSIFYIDNNDLIRLFVGLFSGIISYTTICYVFNVCMIRNIIDLSYFVPRRFKRG